MEINSNNLINTDILNTKKYDTDIEKYIGRASCSERV